MDVSYRVLSTSSFQDSKSHIGTAVSLAAESWVASWGQGASLCVAEICDRETASSTYWGLHTLIHPCIDGSYCVLSESSFQDFKSHIGTAASLAVESWVANW